MDAWWLGRGVPRVPRRAPDGIARRCYWRPRRCPSMLLTIERHRVEDDVATTARRPAAPPDGRPGPGRRAVPVVALRHRPVVALGALLDRSTVAGERLVTAHDVDGRACWIPAEAVWSDAEDAERPQHPRPVGLATAPTQRAGLRRRSERPARMGGRAGVRSRRSAAALEPAPATATSGERRPSGGAGRPPGTRRPDRGRARRRPGPVGGGGDLVDARCTGRCTATTAAWRSRTSSPT